MSTLTPNPIRLQHIETDPANPHLIGSGCAACGTLVFPPVIDCPTCASDNMRPRPLSREGKLYTYSVVHIAPKGWQTPYVIGYVDLPEGVRVYSHIGVDDVSQLHHDMNVQLLVETVRNDEEGQTGIDFRFVPTPGGSI